jgi:hypothetical protein
LTEPLDPNRTSAQPPALREAAEAKRRETVDRLRAGIERLTARSPRPAITAKTIEMETGLAFKTILRNAEAYGLYRDNADAFKASRQARRRSKSSARKTAAPPAVATAGINRHDPLMAYKKIQLVDRLHAALREVDALRSALASQTALCQGEHQRTILSLRADLARQEALDAWRTSELAGR